MFKPRLIALITAIACTAAPLAAQGLGRQLARSGLTQADVDIMVAEGATLYRNGNATVGADTIWQNPETNAYGMAEITTVDGDCVIIAYRFKTTRQSSLQTVDIRRCLVDGRWLLSG